MLKRKRISGNGTPHRQWLYLYINVPLLVLVKIGISGNYKRRAKQVSGEVFGWSIPVFAVKIPFAFQCEQALHRLFGLFNVRFGGSREWFLVPVAPFALAIMLLAWALEWLVYMALAFLVLWLLAHWEHLLKQLSVFL